MKPKLCAHRARQIRFDLGRKAAPSVRWMLAGLVEMCKTLRFPGPQGL